MLLAWEITLYIKQTHIHSLIINIYIIRMQFLWLHVILTWQKWYIITKLLLAQVLKMFLKYLKNKAISNLIYNLI